jgi:hypothetical protein
MASKTLQAWTAGCGTSILVRFAIAVGLLTVLTVCVAGAGSVPLPRGVEREFVVLGAFLAAVLGSVGATIGFAVWLVIRRARQLDAAFAPLGIAAQQYLTNGRQYHGTYGGRQVDAYFYRGPTFELYLGTPLKSRLALAQRDGLGRAVANFVGRQPLVLDDPHLDGLTVNALDERWGRAVLADPRARASLLRLMDEAAPGAGRFEFRQVILQPEGWLLRLLHTRVDSINAESVRTWIGDLHALAEAAEALPPPQMTAVATTLERNARANRGAFVLPAVLVVMGLIGALLVCAVVPTLLLVIANP